MKVFISSVIADHADIRDAAARGCRTLGCDVIRAEEFGANPATPQQVCLAGVRGADVTLLLLGARYGWPQASGLSATHEEYREARDRGPVLVFIEDVTDREAKQTELVQEVQAWGSGTYTASFSTPDELERKVVRALHDLAMATSKGPVDEADLVKRASARALLPDRRFGSADPRLFLIVAGGPARTMLRPQDIEAASLKRTLQQQAMFGDAAKFDDSGAVEHCIEDDALHLVQGSAALRLDSLGSVRVMVPARDSPRLDRHAILPALIEEEVQDRFERMLRLTAWVLDHIDSPRRLTLPTIAAERLFSSSSSPRRSAAQGTGGISNNSRGSSFRSPCRPTRTS